MAVHTFSTKGKTPGETEAIKRIKKLCEQRKLNFSAIVVSLLIQWEKDNAQPRS